MPARSIGSTSAEIISMAKAARGKLRAAKPKPTPPQYLESRYFSNCPALAAFMRYPGRDKRGQLRWVLTAAELRYLVAVGAFTNDEGFCKASQKRLADELGVGRRLVSKWEARLVEKGLAQSIPISRQRGRWGFRILRLIYPPKPQREAQDVQNRESGYLPSQKAAPTPDERLNENKTGEPLRGAR